MRYLCTENIFKNTRHSFISFQVANNKTCRHHSTFSSKYILYRISDWKIHMTITWEITDLNSNLSKRTSRKKKKKSSTFK